MRGTGDGRSGDIALRHTPRIAGGIVDPEGSGIPPVGGGRSEPFPPSRLGRRKPPRLVPPHPAPSLAIINALRRARYRTEDRNRVPYRMEDVVRDKNCLRATHEREAERLP